MKAFIARSLRPLQCAHAMASGGILSGPSSVLFGAAERLARAALQVAGRIRKSTSKPRATPPEPEVPRYSRVEPVNIAYRKDADSNDQKDQVDEASWESFPASDPPGY